MTNHTTRPMEYPRIPKAKAILRDLVYDLNSYGTLTDKNAANGAVESQGPELEECGVSGSSSMNLETQFLSPPNANPFKYGTIIQAPKG